MAPLEMIESGMAAEKRNALLSFWSDLADLRWASVMDLWKPIAGASISALVIFTVVMSKPKSDRPGFDVSQRCSMIVTQLAQSSHTISIDADHEAGDRLSLRIAIASGDVLRIRKVLQSIREDALAIRENISMAKYQEIAYFADDCALAGDVWAIRAHIEEARKDNVELFNVIARFETSYGP